MNIRIGRFLAMATIAVVICSLPAVYAYEGCDASKDDAKCKAHCKKMSEDLKLTPQQEEQLTKDREEYAAKSKGLREKMDKVRADLKAELDKPAPDKARVKSLVNDTKELVGQKMQNKVDKIMNMKKILTPEQFQKMKESRKDWKRDKRGKGGDAACAM